MSVYTEILIEARRKIASRQTWMICEAINSISGHSIEATILKNWIHRMLGDSIGYQSWLCSHYPKIASQMSDEDIRAGRVAWLDWMIANVDKELNK